MIDPHERIRTDRPVPSEGEDLMTPSNAHGLSLSRRNLLIAAGVGGAAIAGSSLLAACGSGSSSGGSAGTVNWSNWPLYIDVDDTTGQMPTLQAFQDQTGIVVNYTDDINDNGEFYAKVRTQLEQGQPIDRDLVVLTNWMAGLWIGAGYAQKLDKANIPNVANLDPAYVDVSFDPGREYSLPWQSGFGAFGWNKAQLKDTLGTDTLVSLDQLWDPKLKGRITVLSEMRDTMGIILAWLGHDPSNFTEAQYAEAIAVLAEKVSSGQIRQVAGNDYVASMESGDVIAVIGWSGDMFQLGEDFGVGLPETGGMLWTDNMLIPVQAANKAGAEAVMNYYYDPSVAAQVAAYVQYVCPVKGAQEAMAKVDPTLVDNQWIFPTPDMLKNSYVFMTLTEEQDAAYQAAFQKAVGL